MVRKEKLDKSWRQLHRISYTLSINSSYSKYQFSTLFFIHSFFLTATERIMYVDYQSNISFVTISDDL